MHSAILLRGEAEVQRTNGIQIVKFVSLPRLFHTNARLKIQTRIEATACYKFKASVIPSELNPV